MHISEGLERSLYAKGNTQGRKAFMFVQFEGSVRSEEFSREERVTLVGALATARDVALEALETIQNEEVRKVFIERANRYEELRYKFAFNPDEF